MSKIHIIIATHGRLGEELISSAQMIAGELENVHALSLMQGMSFEEFAAQASEMLAGFTSPTIVFADLFGGTPCNVMTALSRKYPLRVVSGVNLPVILDLSFKNDENASENLQSLVDESIVCIAESAIDTVKMLESMD